MSKKRRTPQPDVQPAPPGRSAEITREGPSNQALRDQLAGGEAQQGAADLGRLVAVQMVEGAILALQVSPRPDAQLQRFVEVVERSRLPGERRGELLAKLRGDQDVATGIEKLLVRDFGSDSAALRADLVGVLDGVSTALLKGVGDAGVSAGSHTAIAESQITALANTHAPASLTERLTDAAAGVGHAVLRFCRDVTYLVAWDEDEDEDLEDASGYVEVSGS